MPGMNRTDRSSGTGTVHEPPIGVFVTMLATFSFLLHFIWEMGQVPFFVGMDSSPHSEVVWLCTRAALGDVGIAVLALAPLLWVRRGIRRLFALRLPFFLVYVAAGLLITIVFEYVSTEMLSRWEYQSTMPTLPIVETGLIPVLQWIALPALAVIFSRYFSLGWQHAGPHS